MEHGWQPSKVKSRCSVRVSHYMRRVCRSEARRCGRTHFQTCTPISPDCLVRDIETAQRGVWDYPTLKRLNVRLSLRNGSSAELGLAFVCLQRNGEFC